MLKVGARPLLLLPMLLVSCSSTEELRDRIAINPNPCVMDLKTKEIDCKRPLDNEKNLVCFTPKDLETMLKKCKGD